MFNRGQQALCTDTQVLFLDFDGVLHPEFCNETKHFMHLNAFERTLRKLPTMEIVISSTWRLQRSYEELKSYFTLDISRRIVGVTPVYSQLEDIPETLVGYEREAECRAWLKSNERGVQPWLAVDDRSWNFRPFNTHLFLVDGKVGLNEQAADALLLHLLRRG